MSASTDSADESKDGALIDTLPPLPEALRLADQLGAELVRTVAVDMLHHNAAAELRRLHAENDALRADAAENEALRERMADILRRTAVALRGPEPPLARLGWHDLPERAAAAIAAIEVMQRAAQQAAESETPNAELT